MASKAEVWADLTSQLKGWIEGGMTGNRGSRFDTGYGGPNKPNEPISKGEFDELVKDWTQHGKDIKMGTRYAASLSGRAEGIWDLICTKYGVEQPKFNYHIKVPADAK